MDSRSQPSGRKKREVVQERKEHDKLDKPKKVRLESSASATATATGNKTLVAAPLAAVSQTASPRQLAPTIATATATTSPQHNKVVRDDIARASRKTKTTASTTTDEAIRNGDSNSYSHCLDIGNNQSNEAGCSTNIVQLDQHDQQKLESTMPEQVLPSVLDIESALYCLVQVDNGNNSSGSSSGNNNNNAKRSMINPTTTVKEYLSKSTHVKFCVGHAGDASTIAGFYRMSQYRQQQQIQLESPEQLKSAISSPPASLEQTRNTTPDTTGRTTAVHAKTNNDVEESKIPREMAVRSHERSATSVKSSIPNDSVTGDIATTSASSASTPTSTEGDDSSGLLELWLADGMGDEDTPPAVFCLLAYISSNDENSTATPESTPSTLAEATKPPPPSTRATTSATGTGTSNTSQQLGAVAVLTVSWTRDDDKGNGGVIGEVGSGSGDGRGGGDRMLRVEWFHVNELCLESPEVASVLERRMWLRLSILSRLTACQLLLVHSGDNNNVMARAKYASVAAGSVTSLPGDEEDHGRTPRVIPSAE